MKEKITKSKAYKYKQQKKMFVKFKCTALSTFSHVIHLQSIMFSVQCSDEKSETGKFLSFLTSTERFSDKEPTCLRVSFGEGDKSFKNDFMFQRNHFHNKNYNR